jgi:GcrA cell cycle regulator
MTWTDARVALLTRLWTEGLSASAVAQTLGEGISRSAVLGKLQRLGLLKTRRAASPPRPVAGETADGDGKLAAAFRLRRTPPRREPPPSPWKAQAFRPLPGTTPRDWLSRRAGECAFPVGGEGETTRSCCAPCAPFSAYCPSHRAVVFRPAPSLPSAERADLPLSRQAA